MEGHLILSFKKHDSARCLAQLMLALQCSYVKRSRKCPECISKDGEGESLRKHVFDLTGDGKRWILS